MQSLKPWQNAQFGSKIKNAKNMRKTILQEQYSCSVQKTARKNTKYSRNETILKIGLLAKGYSPCKGYSPGKMLSLDQKLKMPKTREKPFYKNVRVVLCKIPLEKTPNIRKMRHFSKSAILQTL